jgi:hypothetical protein
MERDSSGSFPEIFKDQYELKGLYRFLNNEKVEVSSFIESYRKGLTTWALSQKEDTPFYLFQDSTFGKYPGRKVDLGYLETGTDNGVLIHNGILTTSDFEPLGLAVQQFIQRERSEYGKKHQRATRPFIEKESYKWIEGFEFARKFERKTSRKIIQVCDREADIAEVINHAIKYNQGFVINSSHDRSLKDSTLKISDLINKLPVATIVKRPILDARGKEHQLDCQIRFSKVDLEGISKPIYVVNLKQIEEFPKKETSDEVEQQSLANWTIITNLKVKYADNAIEVLDIYNHRWRTCEDLHKCLKTGCQIQERQLQSSQALLRTIAMLSLVAIQLLRLRHLSENQVLTPIDELLSEDEIQVAQITAKQYLKPIDETFCKPNTALWFVLLMARMGGHQGIKQSGMPGWQTIWKGLYHFQTLVDGFIMSKNFLIQNTPTYG